MESMRTAFRDIVTSPLPRGGDGVAAARSAVWTPVFPSPNVPPPVVELPLFTLAPRWFEYYAYIGVGSTPQSMRVLLDTTGNDLSLLGYDRGGHEDYDHNKSSTYVANNTLVRTALPGTDVAALGLLSKDAITFNQDLRLPSQTFTELLNRPETQYYFDDTLADGWLGLGRAKTQQAYAVPSIVDVMINEKRIAAPLVGIHLNPTSTGLVSFGGVNSERFDGNLSFVDVTPLTSDDRDRLWSFRVDSVLINGKPVEIPSTAASPSASDHRSVAYYGGSAVLDAVLPSIRGPREVVDAINSALGQDVGQRVPCAKGNGVAAVNITFVLGGQPFSLRREDLISSAQNGPGCVSLLRASPPNIPRLAEWSIGAPFMQAFYTALDYGDATRGPRIGFARSRRYKPPSFSAYDSLWLVLLVVVLVLIVRSIGRARLRRPSHPITSQPPSMASESAQRRLVQYHGLRLNAASCCEP